MTKTELKKYVDRIKLVKGENMLAFVLHTSHRWLVNVDSNISEDSFLEMNQEVNAHLKRAKTKKYD